MQATSEFGRRPKALGSHSAVGVVGLASCVDGMELQAGCSALQELSGWHVETSSEAIMVAGDFAGCPDTRAAALMQMWQREDMNAIICSRGGYGSNYLLPLLDLEALSARPKVFIGYSDNTSILLSLDRAHIVSFHGPMIASDFAKGQVDVNSFLSALGGSPLDFVFRAESSVQSLVAGEAQGPIVGGCLSVVVTSLGTPWEIETAGKILFLEDVNERPFRIDRMLMHLMLAGKFSGVRGVIFGGMLGCVQASDDGESLPQMIRRILGGLGVPIVFGFPSGHVTSGNITLPFGVPARLQSSESGVRLQVEPSTLI